nr:hypothetical protein [Tanacetum cinerariifolium]
TFFVAWWHIWKIRNRIIIASFLREFFPDVSSTHHTSANIVHGTPSPTDAETGAKTGAETDKMNSEGDTKILNIGEEQRENVADKVDLEEKTAEIDEGQAVSDPGKTPESRLPPERVLMEEDQAGPNPRQSHVTLAGPNPKPMHDDFIATIDQFFNDKQTEDDLGKTTMETKVESMVTVLIHQVLSLVPPLSTPVIDLTPLKPVSSTIQELFFTATTKTTTTTLPLPPPPQQQSSTDHALAFHVSALEQVSLQAPLKERFRDLSEADMKEIIHDRMFESGSYRSLPEHVAFYEALEASIEHDNRDEFLAEKDKSRKRRHNDQDPPPPPLPDSDQGTKKRHDSDASTSHQPQA